MDIDMDMDVGRSRVLYISSFITISSIKEWRSFTICYRLEF